MKLKLTVALCLALTGLCSAVSFAAECPVPLFSWDKIAAVIHTKKTCQDAYDVASSCAAGSSGDIGTVGAAIEVCEAHFGKHPAAEQKIYEGAQAICNRQYAPFIKDGGTIVLSEAAYCHLEVTHTFSNLFETPNTSGCEEPNC